MISQVDPAKAGEDYWLAARELVENIFLVITDSSIIISILLNLLDLIVFSLIIFFISILIINSFVIVGCASYHLAMKMMVNYTLTCDCGISRRTDTEKGLQDKLSWGFEYINGIIKRHQPCAVCNDKVTFKRSD